MKNNASCEVVAAVPVSLPTSPSASVRRWSGLLLAGLFLFSAGCNRAKPITEENLPTGSEQPTDGSTPSTPGGSTTAGTDPANPGATGTPGASPNPGMTAAGPGAGPAATPSDPSSPYATDAVLVNDLLTRLSGGDLAGFLALLRPEVATPAVQGRLKGLLVDRKFRVHPSQPQVDLGGTATAKNVGINLQAPRELSELGDQQIQVNLEKDVARGWAVSGLQVPDIAAIAAAASSPASSPAGTTNPNSPVGVADTFLGAVVTRDFRTAKRAVDSARLTDEKLAALFIVVEEGEFKPNDRKPLIATAARDNSAWVIARLKSPREESDFGIEMERATVEGPWKVVGLNFSKLIQTAAVQAGAGDVAYAPIKKNIKGGDQLVLYFEYDDALVNPRASKQLEIIADILREDPNRVIHINGHADAKGSDNYNEDLSDERADHVRRTLIAAGIPAKQIVTRAFGESAPKAPNLNPDGTDNPTGRAQNRRAEVYLEF